MPVSGKRGFGSMDEARQREIASKGGQAAHQKGSAHEFSPEEARSAGSKGGKAAHEKGSAHEFSSEEAAPRILPPKGREPRAARAAKPPARIATAWPRSAVRAAGAEGLGGDRPGLLPSVYSAPTSSLMRASESATSARV